MNLLANPISAFRKKKQVDLTMDSYEEDQNNTSQDSKLTSGWTASQGENAEPKSSKWITRLGYFFVILALLSGALSMMYLPFILLSPTKFCTLFSASLASSGFALLTLKGRTYIQEKLLSGTVRFYTITLVATNIMGLAASFRDSGAIVCLVMAIAQFVALTYVLFSRLHYGKEFLDNFYGGIVGFFRGLCTRVFRRNN